MRDLLSGPPEVLRLVVSPVGQPNEMRVLVTLPRELVLVHGLLDTVFRKQTLNALVTIDFVVKTTGAGPVRGARAGQAPGDWLPEGRVASPEQVAWTEERRSAQPTARPPFARPAGGATVI